MRPAQSIRLQALRQCQQHDRSAVGITGGLRLVPDLSSNKKP